MNPSSELQRWSDAPNAPSVGTRLGQLSALLDGAATMAELPLPEGAVQNKLFRYLLLRNGNDVKAYVNRCAHFGVPLAERQDLLIFKPRISVSCNVHYARYRWSDGVCESGDCEGESLLSIPVQVMDNGDICIATEQP